MGSVHSISSTKELERFFDHLYGDTSGYAYSPTKNPHTGEFNQYFFEWPAQRTELIQHAATKSHEVEVYHGVALFKSKTADKESFLGTRFVWSEFDGKLPTLDKDTPPPSIRIQSSITGHEHWYWELDGFISDIEVVEDINRRLAYHLQADLSCWDGIQVLRPPSTLHHESSKQVSILSMESKKTSIAYFAALPEIPIKLVQAADIKHIPQALDVLLKSIPWDEDEISLFRAMKIEKGHRSSALTKLAHICVEKGFTNAEALSILLSANMRWKKYAEYRQVDRLLGIINYCRAQHPVDPIEEEVKTKFKIYTYEEFMNTEINLDWVVPGLLHSKGLMMLTGPPKIGKSQFMIRLAERLAKGEPFLKWSTERPVKTLFVSMEMPHEELKYFYDQMRIKENPAMNQNMLIMPLGKSIRFNNQAARHELNKAIEEFQPDGIWFDSFGRGVGDDINSEKIIFQTFDYIDATLRGEYGMFVGFIHHNRKAQIGNKKPNKLEDVYGNQYIGAAVTTGINMWEDKPGSGDIDINCLALRLSKFFTPFRVHRTPNLDFDIHESKILSNDTPILGIAENNVSFTSELGDTI